MSDFDAEQAAAEKRQTEQRQTARDLALMHEADLRDVMSDPVGRRLIARFIGAAGIRKASFTSDPSGRADAFNEGRRDFGVKLEDQVQQVCPDLWRLMMKEHDDAVVAINKTLKSPASRLP